MHPERAKEALRLGAMAVLKYPVPAAELRAAVLQALEQCEAQPSGAVGSVAGRGLWSRPRGPASGRSRSPRLNRTRCRCPIQRLALHGAYRGSRRQGLSRDHSADSNHAPGNGHEASVPHPY